MHLESHANMAQRVDANSASLVVFNLGYLPGADHAVCTSQESTLPALAAAMQVRLRVTTPHACSARCAGGSAYQSCNSTLQG